MHGGGNAQSTDGAARKALLHNAELRRLGNGVSGDAYAVPLLCHRPQAYAEPLQRHGRDAYAELLRGVGWDQSEI